MYRINMAGCFFTGIWVSCALTLIVMASGCSYDPCNPGHGMGNVCDNAGPVMSDEDQGGLDGTTLQLPFAQGSENLCTQGAGGSTSHKGTSTTEAIDLDTPNNADVEIYAPIGGVARVHMESASTNFGYHVNIEVGDGTYAVVAHFSEIFIEDGEEVAAGQLLGYDGCTGACTGDHVHVGLNEGDATKMAQYGESVPVNFYAMDTSLDEPAFATIASEDFTCGTSGGHFYESALPVTMWHPDGTLVKIQNDAKTYLIEDGKARWIADEATFWSYNFDFDEVTVISDEELACMGGGSDLTSGGEVEAGYGEDGFVWLLVRDTDGARWKQMVQSTAAEEVIASWGVSGDLGMDPTISWEDLDRYETKSGYAPFRDGTLVKEASSSDVYVVTNEVAVPVKDWNTYLLLGFGNRTILTVNDGDVGDVMDSVGSCSAGIWCLDTEAIQTCGGGLDLGSGSGDEGGEAIEDTGSVPEEEPVEEEVVEEEPTEDEEEPVEEEEPEAEEEDEEVVEEEPETETEAADDWADYIWIDGDDLCFSADGFGFPYDSADAYMVGYGGMSLLLDFTFQSEFEMSPASGAFCIDTTTLDFDDYEATLVSSLTSSGFSASSYADTGDWWDNYDLCTSGTETADQFCAYQGGWNYLIAFTVDTTGVRGAGDGA